MEITGFTVGNIAGAIYDEGKAKVSTASRKVKETFVGLANEVGMATNGHRGKIALGAIALLGVTAAYYNREAIKAFAAEKGPIVQNFASEKFDALKEFGGEKWQILKDKVNGLYSHYFGAAAAENVPGTGVQG